jgi:hypothetical protein
LEKIAESEMDLDYLGRQTVARILYESATSKAFHALREYDDENVVIAYTRKVPGLDQHGDRCESPQIETDMEPPPIGTPLGKALSRAVFGWGGQRHKATNRQAEQASPRNPTINLA